MSDYDDEEQERELTIDDYRAIVGQLTTTIRLMEDRINGVDRDYSERMLGHFSVHDIFPSMSDDPHWRWIADNDDAKSYTKDMPTRIPSKGHWKFYCGGPLEMIHEVFNAPHPFYETLKAKGAIK